jgi:phosphoribosylamine--glycine ligase
VLEFNCRLGDPETQPIMARLRSDLIVLVTNALDGTLDRVEAEWDRRSALTVVLAAAGYPERPRRGDLIEGLDRVTPQSHPDVVVFHAGTLADDSHVRVNGGRVLGVTALGDSLRQAQRAAYAAIGAVRFDGMQYRTDIGHRALGRRT